MASRLWNMRGLGLRMGPRSGYENGSVCRAWNTYKDVHIYPGSTFLCDTSYKQRLIDLNILPICSWHEYLEMLFVFKGICGIINLSDTGTSRVNV